MQISPSIRRKFFTLSAGLLIGLLLATVGVAQVQTDDPLSDIKAENLDLTHKIAERDQWLKDTLTDFASVQQRQKQLKKHMQRIENRAQIKVMGDAFVQSAIDELRRLPKPIFFEQAHKRREFLLATASDEGLRYEQVLDELRVLDTAVAGCLLPTIPEAQRAQVKSDCSAALKEQRNLSGQLLALDRSLFEALQETDAVDQALMQESEDAHYKLTQLLVWVPGRNFVQTLGGILPAVTWTVSSTNWREAFEDLVAESAKRSSGTVFWSVVTLLLLAARWRLIDRLVKLAPASGHYRPFHITHTLAALCIMLALALPWPIVLWWVSSLLNTAIEAHGFTRAVADALLSMAKIILALSVTRWFIHRHGVAVAHFGWDALSLNYVARALRNFCMLFVPLILIAALNGMNYSPYANRESLGSLAFALALLTLVGFLVRVFREAGLPMQRLGRKKPQSRILQFHKFWFITLVLVPLCFAGLALAGYFTAVAYFFALLLRSLFFVLGAAVFYGLIALWVQVEHARLERLQRDVDARAAAEAKEEADSEEDGEIAIVLPRLDISAIGEQTRAMLDFFITLFLVAGIWSVWKDALPVVSVISNHALWVSSELVNDKTVSFTLTVGHLFQALVIIAITGVAVKNVGALLDIFMLKRLDMRADATYAIKVITRYALMALGLSLASSVLNIGWSKVQWLAAALSVGLGFGLQEIFANFVSGLIVLTERPIRIGDVVTVGDVTGTVARIRARATAVVDFNNKEVIIPNKSFITNQVINWTLSSGTTRLLLQVGVAYGSDTELVQQVLLEAVQANEDVLEQPSPSVYFVNFGESSLDFEIRAFVDDFDKRLRVQHELNTAIVGVLRAHGIEIPFPQRDLHIRSGTVCPS